ncbi:hypothetical protein V1478_013321 [Vespula squamosa]|uniref:Uncharacterized protein n=1 Tax=Vespula squamosa TaxID=30214 RepID=A0ABD2AB25_VESSQ
MTRIYAVLYTPTAYLRLRISRHESHIETCTDTWYIKGIFSKATLLIFSASGAKGFKEGKRIILLRDSLYDRVNYEFSRAGLSNIVSPRGQVETVVPANCTRRVTYDDNRFEIPRCTLLNVLCLASKLPANFPPRGSWYVNKTRHMDDYKRNSDSLILRRRFEGKTTRRPFNFASRQK